MNDLQTRVGEWGVDTFRVSTLDTIRLHFQKEVKELVIAIRDREGCGSDALTIPPSDVANIREEAADCVLLLLHMAHKLGFSLQDACEEKFAVCESRTWGEPDADGVVEHVR